LCREPPVRQVLQARLVRAAVAVAVAAVDKIVARMMWVAVAAVAAAAAVVELAAPGVLVVVVLLLCFYLQMVPVEI
jgi:hypothetical protein